MATQLKKVVAPSGGDYTSLEACVNANEQDLVTADKYFDVEISGDWSGGADTTAVTLHNYTTDATRYINIYTTGDARGNGVWDTDKYILSQSTSAGCITTIANYVTFDGLQVIHTEGTPAGNDSAILQQTVSTGKQQIVKNCILRGGRYPLRLDNTCDYFVFNSLLYGGSAGGVVTVNGTPNCTIYSSTIISAGNSVYAYAGTTIIAKNCYASGGTAAYAVNVGSITKTTCASADATGSAGLQNIAFDTNNFINVTPGSEDLHLSLGSALIGVGTDTSGDSAPMDFTDDIDGDTRIGTWDIGVDEFIVAGAGVRSFGFIV